MKFLHNKRHRLSLALACMASVGVMMLTDLKSSSSAFDAPQASIAATVTSDPDGDGFRPAGPERVSGEIFIDLKDELTSGELEQFAADSGLDLRFSSEPGRQHNTVIATVDESEMPDVLSALTGDSRIETVDPNYLYTLTALPTDSEGVDPKDFPNDPRYNEQWHMKMIDVESAWPLSTGADVVTAVIDTGVAYKDFDDFTQVEDLDQTGFVSGYDFVNKRVEAVDDQCHGTHVAGTIAQSTNNGKGVAGVAFNTQIMPVKVLSRSGSGTLADVADGIRFSADHGATVINMSLGGPFPSASLEDAVAYAHKKGTIVVCAAGNSATKRPEYPAGFPYAVSVSSVGNDKSIAFYSNRGDSISFAAPGGDTRKGGEAGGVLQNTIGRGDHTTSGYFFFQGTSMAAPHAAGVAAMVASTGVTQPSTIDWVIQQSATDMEAEPDVGYGAGLMNATDAVNLSGVTFKLIQLAMALTIACVAGVSMLKRRAVGQFVLSIPAAIVGSSGLFFLAILLPCQTGWSNFFTLGLPSWGIPLMGAAHHGNPLLLSCLIPMLLSILVVEKPALRAIISGLAAGFAAHLFFAAAMSTVSVLYMPILLGRLWLVANGLLCVFLAIVLSEEHP